MVRLARFLVGGILAGGLVLGPPAWVYAKSKGTASVADATARKQSHKKQKYITGFSNLKKWIAQAKPAHETVALDAGPTDLVSFAPIKLRMSNSCIVMGKKNLKAKCRAFKSLKAISKTSLAIDQAEAPHAGVALCNSVAGRQIISKPDAAGARTTFCGFPDGSLIDEASYYYFWSIQPKNRAVVAAAAKARATTKPGATPTVIAAWPASRGLLVDERDSGGRPVRTLVQLHVDRGDELVLTTWAPDHQSYTKSIWLNGLPLEQQRWSHLDGGQEVAVLRNPAGKLEKIAGANASQTHSNESLYQQKLVVRSLNGQRENILYQRQPPDAVFRETSRERRTEQRNLQADAAVVTPQAGPSGAVDDAGAADSAPDELEAPLDSVVAAAIDGDRAACGQSICHGEAAQSLGVRRAMQTICPRPATDRLREANLFCDGAAHAYPNPYRLRQLGDASPAERDCYNYLLGRAYRQSAAILEHSGPGGSSGREALSQANAAWEGDQTCQPSAIDALRSPALLMLAADPHMADSYCRAVRPSTCIAAGGQERTIGGRRSCVIANTVIDDSCVSNRAHMRALGQALHSVFGAGLNCLGGLTPTAQGHLSALHDSAQPQTQICCAQTCAHSLFPATDETVGSSEVADSSGTINGPGTIRLTNGAFTNREFSLSSTLFHEFLHRVGMATHEDHNLRSASTPPHAPGPSGDQCDRGHTLFQFGECHCGIRDLTGPAGATGEDDLHCRRWDAGAPESSSASLSAQHVCGASLIPAATGGSGRFGNLLLAPGRREEGQFCMAMSGCHGGGFVSSDFSHATYAFDPVYACQRSCYNHQPDGQSLNTPQLCIAEHSCGEAEALPFANQHDMPCATPERMHSLLSACQ